MEAHTDSSFSFRASNFSVAVSFIFFHILARDSFKVFHVCSATFLILSHVSVRNCFKVFHICSALLFIASHFSSKNRRSSSNAVSNHSFNVSHISCMPRRSPSIKFCPNSAMTVDGLWIPNPSLNPLTNGAIICSYIHSFIPFILSIIPLKRPSIIALAVSNHAASSPMPLNDSLKYPMK